MAANLKYPNNLVEILNSGGVVVMPTDTVYGMLGKVNDSSVVNHMYEIRKRDPSKPFIILISDIKELNFFSIIPSKEQKNLLNKYWPGPVSIIFDCPNKSLSYLHRGTNTLALRVPGDVGLRNLLKETGPLVAPSANIEKFPESENINDAKNYFGDQVDLYVDGGDIIGKPSKLIRLYKDGRVDIIRG